MCVCTRECVMYSYNFLRILNSSIELSVSIGCLALVHVGSPPPISIFSLPSPGLAYSLHMHLYYILFIHPQPFCSCTYPADTLISSIYLFHIRYTSIYTIFGAFAYHEEPPLDVELNIYMACRRIRSNIVICVCLCNSLVSFFCRNTAHFSIRCLFIIFCILCTFRCSPHFFTKKHTHTQLIGFRWMPQFRKQCRTVLRYYTADFLRLLSFPVPFSHIQQKKLWMLFQSRVAYCASSIDCAVHFDV